MPFLLRLVSLQNTSTRALWPLKLGQFLNGGNPALGRFPQTRTTWDTHSGDKWGSHSLMQIWIAQKYRCKRPEPIFGNPHMIPLLYATETTHFANDDEIARKNVAYLPNFTITISIHIRETVNHTERNSNLFVPGTLLTISNRGKSSCSFQHGVTRGSWFTLLNQFPKRITFWLTRSCAQRVFRRFHGFCMVGYHFHGWWFSLSAWISTNFQPGKSRNIQAMCLSLGLSTRWRWHNVSQNTCFQCDKSKYKASPISPFFCY